MLGGKLGTETKRFEVTGSTLIDVPSSMQDAYALAIDEIVQSCLEAGPASDLHWRKLSMFDALVLNNCHLRSVALQRCYMKKKMYKLEIP